MSLMQSTRPPRWQQLWLRILIIIDQVLMILDLPTLTTSIDVRLARLRRIFYDDPKAKVTYQRVRDT